MMWFALLRIAFFLAYFHQKEVQHVASLVTIHLTRYNIAMFVLYLDMVLFVTYLHVPRVQAVNRTEYNIFQ